MRPSTRQQAIQHMDTLLRKKLKGNRSTRVKEKMAKARNIAKAIYDRFQVGPYQYQIKHLPWFLEVKTKGLKPATRYRYWLAIKEISHMLKKEHWLKSLLHSLI